MPSTVDMRRPVVIGCGYVGLAVAETLLNEGMDAAATTTSSARAEALRAAGLRTVVLELSQRDRLAELLADRDAVVVTVAPNARIADYRTVYLDGMRSLASVLPATPVRRLVYTSSTRVYGRDDGSWVEEDTPPEPRDEKGRILLQSERIALAAFTPSFPRRDPDVARVSSRADRSVTVLRLGGIHGPGREAEPRIVAQAGTTRDDGNVYVNLIHRDDIVEAVRRLLRMPYHGVLNLTDGHPVLRRVWYDRMLAMRNLPAIDWTDRDAPVRGKRVSNMRARKLLGLDFRTPVP